MDQSRPLTGACYIGCDGSVVLAWQRGTGSHPRNSRRTRLQEVSRPGLIFLSLSESLPALYIGAGRAGRNREVPLIWNLRTRQE